VNLREIILENRVKHASTVLAGDGPDYRSKALVALDRYFFLIAFASFVQESDRGFTIKFSTWLKVSKIYTLLIPI
jgi:hypothetical protein